MATYTPNLNLELPDGTDNYSRQIINDNMTAIDNGYGTLDGYVFGNMLKVVEVTYPYYIASGASLVMTKSYFDVVQHVTPGYSILGVAGFSSGSASVAVCYVRPNSDDYFMCVRNDSGSAAGSALNPIIARVYLILIKDLPTP